MPWEGCSCFLPPVPPPVHSESPAALMGASCSLRWVQDSPSVWSCPRWLLLPVQPPDWPRPLLAPPPGPAPCLAPPPLALRSSPGRQGVLGLRCSSPIPFPCVLNTLVISSGLRARRGPDLSLKLQTSLSGSAFTCLKPKLTHPRPNSPSPQHALLWQPHRGQFHRAVATAKTLRPSLTSLFVLRPHLV